MKIVKSLLIFVAFIAFFSSVNAQKNPNGEFTVIKRVTLGGEGGWDYLTLDPKARRLYISRSTHVMVVDADKLEVVGDIPNTPGVHGIALVPELNKGFTSNGKGNTVTVFDLKTLKTISQIPVGKNPDAIIYDPFTKRIFTSNGASQDTTAIDPATEKVVGTLALGGRPEFAVSDGKGKIFVNLEDKSMLVEFDAAALKVLSTWPLAPGEEPTGLAYDPQTKSLYSVCANKLMVVVNAETGKQVTTVPIGDGPDAAAFDADNKLIFSSNREGTLTVVKRDSPSKFSIVSNTKTQRGAKTMAFDPKTHQIFLITAEYGETPAATSENPKPRPAMKPGSFMVMVVGRQ